MMDHSVKPAPMHQGKFDDGWNLKNHIAPVAPVAPLGSVSAHLLNCKQESEPRALRLSCKWPRRSQQDYMQCNAVQRAAQSQIFCLCWNSAVHALALSAQQGQGLRLCVELVITLCPHMKRPQTDDSGRGRLTHQTIKAPCQGSKRLS